MFNFVPWFQNGKEQNFWTSRTWVSIFHSCVFLDLGLMTRVENGNKHLTPIFFNKTCSISSLDSKTVKNIIIFDPKALWWPKFQILSYLSHFLMTFNVFFAIFWPEMNMHTWKLPKRVKEYQNLTKNKENKENRRSECDLSALHSDVFTYTLSRWLASLLSSSQRAVTLVKIQFTTNI